MDTPAPLMLEETAEALTQGNQPSLCRPVPLLCFDRTSSMPLHNLSEIVPVKEGTHLSIPGGN